MRFTEVHPFAEAEAARPPPGWRLGLQEEIRRSEGERLETIDEAAAGAPLTFIA